MGFFDKLFKKKERKYEIDEKNKDNLVVMICPKDKIQLSSKVAVPDDFCAIFLSKEKLLDEIPSGEFEISGLNFAKVCKLNKLDKPSKKGYKTQFVADFYFVNLKENIVKNSFFVKKVKKNVEFKLKFKIVKPKQFLEFLICEKIVFENDYAEKELEFYVSQLIYYHVLDNKIETKEKLLDFVFSKLEKIGVLGLDFDVKLCLEGETDNLFDSSELENVKKFDLDYGKRLSEDLSGQNSGEEDFDTNCLCCENFQKNFEKDCDNNNFTQENAKILDKNQFFGISKTIVDLDDVKTESVNYFVCENCGAKLPQNAQKCFVCGKSFVEKNFCENCGKEISVGEYVCPHCKSVIIN
ncbi:MAG: zinc ribbon domain-containing protein [Christensenellales bacterium]